MTSVSLEHISKLFRHKVRILNAITSKTTLAAQSGGGLVKVKMNGQGSFHIPNQTDQNSNGVVDALFVCPGQLLSLFVDSSIAADLAMTQKLLKEAVNSANQQVLQHACFCCHFVVMV